MNNQAAQTMPYLIVERLAAVKDHFPAGTDERKAVWQAIEYFRAAALSQTAGEGVYGLLKAIRYNAENGSQDRPLHDRLRMIARDANEAIGRIDRAMLAAAPAASGGEDSVPCGDCDGRGHTDNQYPGSDFQPPEPELCSSCGGSGRWDANSSQPQAAASVSERLLALADEIDRHGAGDAEEGSLRFIAKRNLRKMIEIGSTDKKTMLLCLEELS